MIPDQVAEGLLERLRTRLATYPLIEGWPLLLESLGPGRARVVLDPGQKHLNLAGTVHGGVLATLADIVCALALSTAFDGAMPFATSDLHIRYLEPAEGATAAEAEIVRISSRGAVLECRILCGDTLVALCTAHFAIRSYWSQA